MAGRAAPGSGADLWREKTPARPVRPVAAPILAVLARQHALVRHCFAEMSHFVAGLADRNAVSRDGEAVMLPAAPFARCGVPVLTVMNPVIMRNQGWGRAEQAHACYQPGEGAFYHTVNLATNWSDAARQVAKAGFERRWRHSRRECVRPSDVVGPDGLQGSASCPFSVAGNCCIEKHGGVTACSPATTPNPTEAAGQQRGRQVVDSRRASTEKRENLA